MDPTQWGAPFPVVVAGLFVVVCLRAGGTFWLGRLAVAGARHTRFARLLDSDRYHGAARRINDYGAPIVAASFLTIGFQTMANFTAGATQMPLRKYLPALGVGGLVWALIYATIGTLGVNLAGWLWDLSPLIAFGLAALTAAAVAGLVLWRYRQPAGN